MVRYKVSMCSLTRQGDSVAVLGRSDSGGSTDVLMYDKP